MSRSAGRAATEAGLANVSRLSVFLGERKVGSLAITPEGLAAFEYDAEWVDSGFSISPLSLPLRPGVFVPELDPFDGLFGVFQDSLPDGWGALLLDRMLKEQGIDSESLTTLARLSIVGSNGRGALRYEPEIDMGASASSAEALDELAVICEEIFEGKPVDDLDEAYAAGGSSAGARPKAYVEADGAEWLVKFPSSMDPPGIGCQEYAYSKAARECGLNVPETRLFPSDLCEGYFGSRRFDRNAAGAGIHMVTASGMLEVTHRQPVLDYGHLFQVTLGITHDERQAWELFRTMCFNVFAHNQDDHSNNFAWLCEDGVWRLAPAYDLTYSTSFGGEHATTVNGNGNPEMTDVLAIADKAGLDAEKAKAVAHGIEERCARLVEELGLAR